MRLEGHIPKKRSVPMTLFSNLLHNSKRKRLLNLHVEDLSLGKRVKSAIHIGPAIILSPVDDRGSMTCLDKLQ